MSIPGFNAPTGAGWPPQSVKEDCPCGCTGFGVLRKKTGHVRACPCKRCEAPRYKQRATRREKKIARDLGGERHALSGALSGADVTGAGLCVEETANARVCGPVRTAWVRKAARIVERRQKFGEVPVLVVSDEKPWLAVMLYEDLVR